MRPSGPAAAFALATPLRERLPVASPRSFGRSWILPAAGLLACAAGVASGGDTGSKAEPPQENVSYVPSDDETVRKSFATAEAATKKADWPAVVRALQRVVEGSKEAVVPVAEDFGESGVFEGAGIVAHHRVVALGAGASKAYESEFGARAATLLADGVARHDVALVERAADVYLPTTAGRRAALFLVDLALERGDRDEAFAWLDRLEDLEEVSSETLAADTASWRAERLERAAAALAASVAARPRVRAWLEGLAALPGSAAKPTGDRPAPAAEDFYRRAPLRDFPTAGGGPSRTAIPAALPSTLSFVANEPIVEAGDDSRSLDPPGEADERGKASRPSPWLPARGVVANDRLFVSDGRFLRVFDLRSQRRDWPAIALVSGASASDRVLDRGERARGRWGMIEGFGVSVYGDVAYANVPAEDRAWAPRPVESDDPTVFGTFPRDATDPSTDESPSAAFTDRVVAVNVREPGGAVLWTAGPGVTTPGLVDGVGLFGTPLLYAGAIHVAGVRARKNNKLEAWHVALDPATGAVRSATRLGEGSPIRAGRPDEAIPTSCSASHGRVHVVTALGIASAVDARTGRTLWTYRYDRGALDGPAATLRLEEKVESAPRKTTFINQPPLVSGGQVVFAPTDAYRIFCLHDRPRGAHRRIVEWKCNRDGRSDDPKFTYPFRNLGVEQLAAVTEARGDVPATLVVVGQGWGLDPLHDPFNCVAALDVRTGVVRWQRALPFGDLPEPFGLALVTENEVLVSTAKGIARYRLKDGADLAPLDATTIPASRARLLYPAEHNLFGNLVPVPGRGVVAINEAYASFWLEEPSR